MENKLKCIIKRGTQLLWLYGGIIDKFGTDNEVFTNF